MKLYYSPTKVYKEYQHFSPVNKIVVTLALVPFGCDRVRSVTLLGDLVAVTDVTRKRASAVLVKALIALPMTLPTILSNIIGVTLLVTRMSCEILL